MTILFALEPATISAIAREVAAYLKPHFDRIEAAIEAIAQKESIIVADLTALQAEVERNTSVEKSALALIQGFAAQLAAAGTDPVKLQALQDTLKANDDELAAAVTANTPAAPPTT